MLNDEYLHASNTQEALLNYGMQNTINEPGTTDPRTSQDISATVQQKGSPNF